MEGRALYLIMEAKTLVKMLFQPRRTLVAIVDIGYGAVPGYVAL